MTESRFSRLFQCVIISEKRQMPYDDYRGDRIMEITKEVFEAIIDAYPYEIVFVDRTHTVRYMNRTARKRYGARVNIGASLFNCHNESTKPKIEKFLERADAGEDEMFETYNRKTGEREFFVPVRDSENRVIGYFERHEVPWTPEEASIPVGDYWLRRLNAQNG